MKQWPVENGQEGSIKGLGGNAIHMMLGNGAKLGIQAVYFVLMARNLGVYEYGAFVAVVAAAAIAVPYVGNGFGSLMVKHVARDRSLFSEYFGNLLVVTLVSGLVLSGPVVLLSLVMLPKSIPPSVVVMLVATDLLIFPHATVAGVAFWSLERLNWTAALNVTASAMRLGGLIVIVILHRPTVTAWAIAYLLSSVLSSGIAMACALSVLGRPHAALWRVRGELWEGFQFSVSLSAQTIYNDIDKTMLARLSTLAAAGVYGAAYRLIDVAFIPVGSLLSAALPRFFRQGTYGIRASLHYGCRLLKQVLPYPAVAFLGLLLGAKLIPVILGHQYEQAVDALRWLAILPLLKTVHYFIANSLTGSGYQGSRTIVQVGVAVFNIGINLWVIPSYGWRGAAWSSIASDSLLAVSLLLLALVLAKRAASPCDSVGHTAPEST